MFGLSHSSFEGGQEGFNQPYATFIVLDMLEDCDSRRTQDVLSFGLRTTRSKGRRRQAELGGCTCFVFCQVFLELFCTNFDMNLNVCYLCVCVCPTLFRRVTTASTLSTVSPFNTYVAGGQRMTSRRWPTKLVMSWDAVRDV